MKILFFTHYFPPEVNAPASRTYDNTKRWVKAGHQVTVVTCAPNCPDGIVFPGFQNKLFQTEWLEGIKIIRIWTYVVPNSGTFKRILNYISYMISAIIAGLVLPRPQIVVATSPQFFCGLAGVVLHKLRKFTFVLEIRDIWPEGITIVGALKPGPIVRILEWLEKYMYRSADAIVTVGNGYKAKIVEKNISSHKVKVVYNGADLDFYQKSKKDADFLQKYNLSNKTIVAYIGTIGMTQGLDIIINAAAKTKGENIVYLLVGDGARRHDLMAQVQQQNLDNIVFTGRLPKKTMPTIWSSIDICLIPLRKTELFKTVVPSKLFEAMAMQCPIIAAIEGEVATIVGTSKAGIAIEPENAQQLVEKIHFLQKAPEIQKQMGENGRAYVMENFDRDKLAQKYCQILSLELGK